MKLEIIKSNDGSSTLKRPDLNETYHSIHGALAESRHVFIKNGIELVDKKSIRIFEVGFGTGLNAMTALEWGMSHPDVEITYHALKHFQYHLMS